MIGSIADLKERAADKKMGGPSTFSPSVSVPVRVYIVERQSVLETLSLYQPKE